ncbi:hypothetical protein [Streptomyces enissocaesilis]|uniref:Transposase n=1 Tax=Streptomyces enissocaesilis TaxID=332589 RepID=A0ABP6K8K5_9ACTN
MTDPQITATAGRPARPAGYWERIDALVATAPPLSDTQRAAIRVAFHQPGNREEKAA